MNMKNATILLIFLLAVIGLIIGVYYTEADNIEKTSQNDENLIFEDLNDNPAINLSVNENQSLYNFLT